MKKVAVVGSGIAGLSCAYHLRDVAEITVFEKNNYVGGHSNTIDVGTVDPASFDTGFMVFNHVTYPNLVKHFNELGVSTVETDMSFSVNSVPENIVWNGAGIDKLFGQRKNLLSPRFYGFVAAVNRFNQLASAMGAKPSGRLQSVADFIDLHQFSPDFLNWYLIPMCGAIWSIPPEEVLAFPIEMIARFFYNHGFLGLNTHHQWFTVKGGARNYVQLMRERMKQVEFKTDSKVRSVSTDALKAEVFLEGTVDPLPFDAVVVAAHADEALGMLARPSVMEQDVLSCFKYQYNHTVVHSDETVMPNINRCWAAWNVRIDDDSAGGDSLLNSTHYWMNRLQHLPQKPFYAVSLNAAHLIDPDKIHCVIDYHHPRFTVAAVRAQQQLPQLNQQSEQQRLFFCGSYFKYGFHEDAYTAGLTLANQLKPKLA